MSFLITLIAIMLCTFLTRCNSLRIGSMVPQRLSSTARQCHIGLHPKQETNLKPILVSLEGNIGAGKSTLLKSLLARNPTWAIVDEPVSTWLTLKTDSGESMLEVFYKDRKRWSYAFQTCALLTRYQMIENAYKKMRDSGLEGKQIMITERCLDTDYHVFAKMLRAEGSMDGLELGLYEQLLSELKKSTIPLSAVVHVDTVPTLCMQRITQRGRKAEANIEQSYLNDLDKAQNLWLDSLALPIFKSHNKTVDDVEAFVRGLLA